jgi:putative nucleotidyltransferase with HDIG domain
MKDLITQTMKFLNSTLRNMSLYPLGHPAIFQPVTNAHACILKLTKERDPIVLGLIEDVLVFDEIPFYETESVWKEMYTRLRDRKIESIALGSGLEVREVQELVNTLMLSVPETEALGGFAKLLEKRQVVHIRVKDLPDDDLHARAREVYDRSISVIFDIMSELRMGKIPSSENAKQVISEMSDLILQDKNALLALTMLKGYDEYTYVHSVNVGILCLAYAAHEGLTGDELRGVGLAGLLHDVGKVRTAEEIVKKPGSLTEEEIAIMKKHPVLGAEILSRMKDVSPETHDMVLMHHVKFNHEGYPKLETGRTVHPYSMVVAIADCYDALTTLRPYQKPRPPTDAIKLMRKLAGKDLDPEMLGRFVDMLGTYPAGTFVRLSTNEIAIVVTPNALDVVVPKVKVILDTQGASLSEPLEVDLAEGSETQNDADRRIVVAGVNPLMYGLDPTQYL